MKNGNTIKENKADNIEYISKNQFNVRTWFIEGNEEDKNNENSAYPNAVINTEYCPYCKKSFISNNDNSICPYCKKDINHITPEFANHAAKTVNPPLFKEKKFLTATLLIATIVITISFIKIGASRNALGINLAFVMTMLSATLIPLAILLSLVINRTKRCNNIINSVFALESRKDFSTYLNILKSPVEHKDRPYIYTSDAVFTGDNAIICAKSITKISVANEEIYFCTNHDIWIKFGIRLTPEEKSVLLNHLHNANPDILIKE